ncbi:hypothetical protein Q1695_009506 [Nippostrongylus brasiliensis]|nr:hypothetical protein Q1695_009506 [Nippostrongylus brasiliensis]
MLEVFATVARGVRYAIDQRSLSKRSTPSARDGTDVSKASGKVSVRLNSSDRDNYWNKQLLATQSRGYYRRVMALWRSKLNTVTVDHWKLLSRSKR